MKVGGGGTEIWMLAVPLGVGFLLLTIAMGGPAEAASYLERLAYNAWDAVSSTAIR